MFKFKNSIGKEIDPITYTLNIMERFQMLKFILEQTLTHSLIKQNMSLQLRTDTRSQVFIIFIPQTVPKIKDIWTRLRKETELSIQIAQELKK